jgi:hypothetical protein
MKRRAFIALLGGGVVAWHTDKVWRIGFLTPEPPTPAMLHAFRDGMCEHGYIEGKNLSIDARWPQGCRGI